MSHKESISGMAKFLIYQTETNLIAFVYYGYKTYVIKTAYLSILVADTELTDCLLEIPVSQNWSRMSHLGIFCAAEKLIPTAEMTKSTMTPENI